MADDTILAAIWEQTLKSYQEQTHRSLTAQGSIIANIKTVDDLAKTLETQQQGFETWRKGHENMWSALKKCITPISVIGQVGKVAVDGTPAAPGALVFGAALYLLKVLNTLTQVCPGCNIVRLVRKYRARMMIWKHYSLICRNIRSESVYTSREALDSIYKKRLPLL